MGTCHFEPPEHMPRTSARVQTCALYPGVLSAFYGAESTRKDPRPEEKKCPSAKKTHLCIATQGSPLGCVPREIPRVTQVDEKGHEGNTAGVTAYIICWRKHGMYQYTVHEEYITIKRANSRLVNNPR